MTNTIAIGLGGLILVALLADIGLNGGNVSLFIAREIFDLTEWLAFWR